MIRWAISSSVPISPVLNPSLYWTRSSIDESAHMPLRSPVDDPACWTELRKPSTAGRWAFSTMSRSCACASSVDSRAMTKPLMPKRGGRDAERSPEAAEAATPATLSA